MAKDLDPTRCQAINQKRGDQCRSYPMKGLTVCRFHGGAAKRARNKSVQYKKDEKIRKAAQRLGVPIDTDPKEGILQLIRQKAGEIEWYRMQIAALGSDDDLVWGKAKETIGTGDDGDSLTYEAGVNTWLKLKNEAEKDLARYAEVALKYDIDERRIALAQESVTQVEAVIRFILGDIRLGLGRDKQALVPELMRDAVKAIVIDGG